MSGELIPANEDDLPNRCNDIPDDAFKVFMGLSTLWFPGPIDATADLHVLEVGRMPVFSLRLTSKGLLVTAKVFGNDGRIIAEVVDNQFRVNPNNYFRIERRDRHELAVYDQYARRCLYIRMLNPRGVKVLGEFYSGTHGPLRVTEKGIFHGDLPMPLVLSGCKETGLTLWDSEETRQRRLLDSSPKWAPASVLPDSVEEFTINCDSLAKYLKPRNREPYIAAQQGRDFVIDAFIALDLRYYETESGEVALFTEDPAVRYAIEDESGDTVCRPGEAYAQLVFAVMNPRLIPFDWRAPHQCKLGLIRFGATMNAKGEVAIYKIPIPGIWLAWTIRESEGGCPDASLPEEQLVIVPVLNEDKPVPIHLSYGGTLRGSLPSAKSGDNLWFIVGRKQLGSLRSEVRSREDAAPADTKVIASFVVPYDVFVEETYSILTYGFELAPVSVIVGIDRNIRGRSHMDAGVRPAR